MTSVNSSKAFAPITKDAILSIFKANQKSFANLPSLVEEMPEVFSPFSLIPEGLSESQRPDPRDLFVTNQPVSRTHQKPAFKKKYVPRSPFSTFELVGDHSEKVWLYIDDNGDTQGPFDTSEMNEWFNGKFFSYDMQTKFKDQKEFTKLIDLLGKEESSQYQSGNTSGSRPFSRTGQNDRKDYGHNQGYNQFPKRTGDYNKASESDNASSNQGSDRFRNFQRRDDKPNVQTTEDRPFLRAQRDKTDDSDPGSAKERQTEKPSATPASLGIQRNNSSQGQAKPLEPIKEEERRKVDEPDEKEASTVKKAEEKRIVEEVSNVQEEPQQQQPQRPVEIIDDNDEEWTSIGKKSKGKKNQAKGGKPVQARKPEVINPVQPKAVEKPIEKLVEKPSEKIAEVPVVEPTKAPQEEEKVNPDSGMDKTEQPEVKEEESKESNTNTIEGASPLADASISKEPHKKLVLPKEIQTVGVVQIQTKASKKGKKKIMANWADEEKEGSGSATLAKEEKPIEELLSSESDFPSLGPGPSLSVQKNNSKPAAPAKKVEEQPSKKEQQKPPASDEFDFPSLATAPTQTAQKTAPKQAAPKKKVEEQPEKPKQAPVGPAGQSQAPEKQQPSVTNDDFPTLGMGAPAKVQPKPAPKKVSKTPVEPKKAESVLPNKDKVKPVQETSKNPKYLNDFPSL